MGVRVKSLKLSEAQFTTQVLQYARIRGWRTYHARAARTANGWRTPVQGDGKGFLDTIFVRERLVWAEQKMPGEKLTPEQAAWYLALVHAKQEVYVWEPTDWPTIEMVLS